MNLKGIRAWLKFRGRRLGFVAFFFQRFSGLFLLGYLYLHLYDLRLLVVGPSAYEAFLGVTTSIAFLPLYVILFGVAIYHGANGLRVMLNEFGYGVGRSRQLFWVFAVGAMVLWIIASYVIASLLFSL